MEKLKLRLVAVAAVLLFLCFVEWTLGWVVYDLFEVWRGVVNSVYGNILLTLNAVTVSGGLFVAWALKFFIPASLGKGSVQEEESNENVESRRSVEVKKTVDQNELVARLNLCRRIALANIPRSRGDGTFLWQGRLAAYNEILAAVQGNTETLLQFTVVTEENLELARKLSEQLDSLQSKEVES